MLDVRFASCGDADIAYHCVGDGDTTLIWSQGVFTHREVYWSFPPFRRYCEALGEFTRLVLYDKRGMGMSSRASGAAPWDRRMEDIEAIMEAEGIERTAVMGESEGGPLAILFAATHPEQVSHLILQGAEARERNDEDWQWGDGTAEEQEHYFRHIGEWWGRETAMAPRLFGADVGDPPWIREAILRMQRNACSPREWEAFARRSFEIDVREIATTVRVPTLVLTSSGDRQVHPENSRVLAKAIPNALLVERHSDDHLPWLDPEPVVAQIREFLTGTASPAPPTRLLATVLFTDVVGSTALAAELGDSHWRSLLEAHHDMSRREFAYHGGREVASGGDGFVAMFDAPGRAIACAQAILSEAASDGLSVRAGVHTGEVERIGDDIAGIGVHIGARIGAMASGGEILASGSVRDIAAGSSLVFLDRGDHELKGVPGRWRIYAVDGDGRHG
ncbi:MAG: adenylate/guanylate cyclase domain-containing protein [Ilumatobacter sp.]|nr:adenylate/guanylate cyclase domain-containing protein [Ilumatobacter sp.]